jgi:tripartite-type tricarboxylate transporter receptor subunit TctC
LRANASTAGPRCSEVKARFDGLGMETAAQTPAPFDAFIAQEFAKWRKLIKQAGIEAQ